jgi:hypothetical protein
MTCLEKYTHNHVGLVGVAESLDLEFPEMSQKCPHCGAEYPSNEQCRDRFDLCLALEFENPTVFGSVHHLTVLCYMLQHNEYSRDTWLEARKMIAQFIQEGATPLAMRKQNRSRMDSLQRTWSVTKGEKLSEFDTIAWTHTIADVRLDNPEIYCSDVRLWTAGILKDTESLMQELIHRVKNNQTHS